VLLLVRTLHLPNSLRQQLKTPVGELVEGTVAHCNDVLRKTAENAKPSPLILVGDTISRNAKAAGIMADVIILDNLEKRHKANKFSVGQRRIFQLKNQPGTIDANAWEIIRSAIESRNSIVNVEGEEDLLVLVAIDRAPIGSLVAYGQPDRGIVLVIVTDLEKNQVKQITQKMQDAAST
jgi:GTP-dependent dephospho-CoA kinase